MDSIVKLLINKDFDNLNDETKKVFYDQSLLTSDYWFNQTNELLLIAILKVNKYENHVYQEILKKAVIHKNLLIIEHLKNYITIEIFEMLCFNYDPEYFIKYQNNFKISKSLILQLIQNRKNETILYLIGYKIFIIDDIYLFEYLLDYSNLNSLRKIIFDSEESYKKLYSDKVFYKFLFDESIIKNFIQADLYPEDVIYSLLQRQYYKLCLELVLKRPELLTAEIYTLINDEVILDMFLNNNIINYPKNIIEILLSKPQMSNYIIERYIKHGAEIPLGVSKKLYNKNLVQYIKVTDNEKIIDYLNISYVKKDIQLFQLGYKIPEDYIFKYCLVEKDELTEDFKTVLSIYLTQSGLTKKFITHLYDYKKIQIIQFLTNLNDNNKSIIISTLCEKF